MVHTTVTIVAPPAQKAEILRTLRALLAPTRVEPGCLRCQLFENAEHAHAFLLVEEWATDIDFRRRLRSDSYMQLLKLMELSSEPPDIRFLVVTEIRGMDAIHAART